MSTSDAEGFNPVEIVGGVYPVRVKKIRRGYMAFSGNDGRDRETTRVDGIRVNGSYISIQERGNAFETEADDYEVTRDANGMKVLNLIYEREGDA